MPLYSYMCRACEHENIHISRMNDKRPKFLKCEECGGEAIRFFKPPQVSVFQEYVTKHITGEPVRVASASQEKAICDKHGVYRLADSEAIPKQPTKEQRYKDALSSMPSIKEDYERTRQQMGVEEPRPKPKRKARKSSVA